MGGPMARNLARADHQVMGFDLAAPAPEGMATAHSVAKAPEAAEVIITMLPNGQILRAVAVDAIGAARAGAVLCDCSTVDVESARAVAALAQAAGLGALDAPSRAGSGRGCG